MKQHKITIGTISKGFREEIYLLKEDILKLIDKCESHSWSGHKCILVEELKLKINGENKEC